jgi:hypothetical protein
MASGPRSKGGIRRQYFGWFKQDVFFLSQQPPDAPIRPSIRIETIDEVKALLARRGVEILWWPPLPDKIHAEIQKGPRLEGGG